MRLDGISIEFEVDHGELVVYAYELTDQGKCVLSRSAVPARLIARLLMEALAKDRELANEFRKLLLNKLRLH